MTGKKKPSTDMRFGEAIEKLESTLRRVESEEIDIDDLADELKSAAQLLEICREKIRKAELEVSQIVQALDEDEDEEGDED